MSPALSGITILMSSIAADGGSGSNENARYVSNFSNLIIGMRNDIYTGIAQEWFSDSTQTHLRTFVLK